MLTLAKLVLLRFRLYEQLRRRPKSRFSQNCILYTMQTQKRARSAKKAIFPPVRKTGPRAQHTKSTLILLLLPLVKKVIIISIIIAHAKLSRDSFTPTMFISSSGMPERVTCKISGRYVPISPTYDQNEFVKFYNKETHQNSFFKFLSKFH